MKLICTVRSTKPKNRQVLNFHAESVHPSPINKCKFVCLSGLIKVLAFTEYEHLKSLTISVSYTLIIEIRKQASERKWFPFSMLGDRHSGFDSLCLPGTWVDSFPWSKGLRGIPEHTLCTLQSPLCFLNRVGLAVECLSCLSMLGCGCSTVFTADCQCIRACNLDGVIRSTHSLLNSKS